MDECPLDVAYDECEKLIEIYKTRENQWWKLYKKGHSQNDGVYEEMESEALGDVEDLLIMLTDNEITMDDNAPTKNALDDDAMEDNDLTKNALNDNAMEDISAVIPQQEDSFCHVLLKVVNERLNENGWINITVGESFASETIGVTGPKNGKWNVGTVKCSDTNGWARKERPPYLVTLTGSDHSITLLCAHAPAPAREEKSGDWYTRLNILARRSASETHVILAADMNTKEHNNVYKHWTPESAIHVKEKTTFESAKLKKNQASCSPYDKILGVSCQKPGAKLFIKAKLKISEYRCMEGGRRYSDHAMVTREFIVSSEKSVGETFIICNATLAAAKRSAEKGPDEEEASSTTEVESHKKTRLGVGRQSSRPIGVTRQKVGGAPSSLHDSPF